MRGLIAALAIVGAVPCAVHAQVVSRVDVVKGARGTAANEELLRRAAAGFSGAVIAEVDGEVVLEAGYGLANRERQIPFTSSTIAQVGSITKQFTAAAIVDLWRRGRLSFTDSVGRFFPDAPPATRSITLHQLLTHTSGMAEYCGGDFARAPRAEFLRRCLGMPLARASGSGFGYSNPGYSVLATIVEQQSGTSIDAYLHERFFAPSGMRRTGYAFPGVSRDSFAVGYLGDTIKGVIDDSLRALGGDDWNLRGNGGMQAPAKDMWRWYRALRDGPVFTDSMRRAIMAPHALRSEGVWYGYGWFVRVDQQGTVRQVSHSGSDGVFYAAFVWLPVDRVFLYVVSNFGESDLARGTAPALLKILRGS